MKYISQILFSFLIVILFFGCGEDAEQTPVPVITSISDSIGTPGSTVTILGDNFSLQREKNVVTFNGVVVSLEDIIIIDKKTLVVKVPGEATTGIIKVIANERVAKGPLYYVLLDGLLPEVEAILPSTGSAGLIVTIKGKNFFPVPISNQILFNGIFAKVLSASPTELRAVVPAGSTSGTITMLAQGFTIQGPVFNTDNTPLQKNLFWSTAPDTGLGGTGNQYLLSGKSDGSTSVFNRKIILSDPLIDLRGNSALQYSDGYLYFTEVAESNNTLSRIKADGIEAKQILYSKTLEEVGKQSNFPKGIAINALAGSLYFVDQDPNTFSFIVSKGSVDGTADLSFLNNSLNYFFTNPSQMAINETSYFVADNHDIVKGDLEDMELATSIYYTDGQIIDLKIFGDKIYWIEYLNDGINPLAGAIKCSKLDGSDVKIIVSDIYYVVPVNNASRLAITAFDDNVQLYWTLDYDIWLLTLNEKFAPVSVYNNVQIVNEYPASSNYKIADLAIGE